MLKIDTGYNVGGEVMINGEVFVRKTQTIPNSFSAIISEIMPCYQVNKKESLILRLQSDIDYNLMPANSKLIKPGDRVIITKKF